MQRWTVWWAVVSGGYLSLAVEIALARLLRPWFGDWLAVWAAVIGFVLLYLALGNSLGGRWSRRDDPLPRMGWALLIAGLDMGLIPWVGRPLLRWGMEGMREYALLPPLLALTGVAALAAPAVILLGTLSPLAVRALTTRAEESGAIAGRVLAVGTGASLIGALSPVFLWLPWLGTQRTFTLLACWALISALFLALAGRRPLLAGLAGVGFVAGVAWLVGAPTGPIKGVDPAGRGEVIYEYASAYNFIQVVQWDEERWLRLNEGEGIHSVWRPGAGLSEGIWDYFLLAPYFRPRAAREVGPRQVLIIGLAGGTIAHLYTRAFGDIPMVGVELDPQVIAVAEKYFALGDVPSLTTVAMDGRMYLYGTDEVFDVVIVDAYRPPYIPFQLTTVEFFSLVSEHLTPDGVVAVNVARTAADRRLVEAISATLYQVFPSVFVVDEPLGGAAWGNSMVVASRQRVTLADFWDNVSRSRSPYVQEMARRARGHVSVAPQDGIVLWDDRAPVEQIVHAIIAAYLFGR